MTYVSLRSAAAEADWSLGGLEPRGIHDGLRKTGGGDRGVRSTVSVPIPEPAQTRVTRRFVRPLHDSERYEAGLIYRASRLVNWCPYLRTALSDMEVEHESLSRSTHLTLPGRQSKYALFAYPVSITKFCLPLSLT